jgi:elongator complex protein 4
VEEEGTTDYGGALVRFYAAEGVVQGHRVHVVGVGEGWGRGLPGLSEKDGKKRVKAEGAGAKKETGVGADAAAERMKIAWRYEGLGEFGSQKERGTRGAGQGKEDDSIFCHTFDLAKRLSLPVGGSAINYIPIRTPTTSSSSNSGSTWTPPSPFASVLQNLQRELSTSPPHTIHRLILPSLLSPALYPPSSSAPTSILQFLHALRALLRIYPTRLTAISTLPLSLFPRTTGLVRIMELLSDGVVTLSPFPHSTAQLLSTSAAATNEDDKPQGLFTIHKLPVYHEKGGGTGAEGLGEDLAFVLSRRRFKIITFSLPPVEGDREAQEEAQRGQSGMPRKEELEF